MNTAKMIKLYYPENKVLFAELHYCKILLALGTRTHYVYFLLAELDDGQQVVKIGTTTNIARRLLLIKQRVPYKIKAILGQVEGDQELESHLHLSFCKFKYSKEWFYYEPIRHHIDDLLENYGVSHQECFEKRDAQFGKIEQQMSEQCNN
jgi:hypothetical protein